MAGRKFSFFESYADMLDQLDDAQCAEFVRAMYRWAFEGEEPEFAEPALRFAWPSIAEQITAGVEISERSREAGKRGGRPRKDAKKRGAKSTPKSTPLSTAKSTPKRGAERGRKATGQDWTGLEMNESSPRTGRADALAPLGEGAARSAARDTLTEDEFEALVRAMPATKGC